MKKLLAMLMKRSIFLIMLLGCVMLYSSCEGYTANAPAGPFSREDWNACGFKPWAGIDEFEARFGTPPTASGQTHNTLGWLCGDGVERGAFTNYTESADLNGGSINIFGDWLLGKEYKRLYTEYNWTLTVTDMSAGIALPRGLKIGSSVEQIKNAFGLGEADKRGIYYGDGENVPYAIINDIDYNNYKKEITLAVPAGETNDERYNYTCILKFMFDGKDSLAACGYMSLLKYSILPGLPEPEKVSELRVYSIGEQEPERVLKFDEAIDTLACIQNAGTNPSEKKVNPTHNIEIVSGGDTYTLKYGDGFIEAPDGKVYEIGDGDKDALFISVPGLCTYKRSYIRNTDHKAVELSAEQEKEIKRIIGSMVVPGEQDMSARGQCRINVLSGDSFDSYIYLFGMSSSIIFKGKSYRISEQDSDIIRKIYNEVFEVPMPEPDPGAEHPCPGTEPPSISTAPAISEVIESPAPVLSGEPLLPGLPSPKDITEVRIWHIGRVEITVIFTPLEAQELFGIIQAGSDKPLKGKLEAPTHKIKIISGGKEYVLTVGSNGIKAPNGKAYSVVFTDHANETYLFLDGIR